MQIEVTPSRRESVVITVAAGSRLPFMKEYKVDEYRCIANIRSINKHEEDNILASDERQAKVMFLNSLKWRYNREDISDVEVIKVSNTHIKKL